MLLLAATVTALIPSLVTASGIHVAPRDPTVQIIAYHNGDCSGPADFSMNVDPRNAGCINLGSSGNYGSMYPGSSNCKIKYWELQNCRGKATVHPPQSQCIPAADKDGMFYILDGVSSFNFECGPETVTVTSTGTPQTSTTTTTLTVTSTFTHNDPFTRTSTSTSFSTAQADSNGNADGINGFQPGQTVVKVTQIEVRITVESETVDDKGNNISDEGFNDGDSISRGVKGSSGVTEGNVGEEGETNPQGHVD